MSEHQSNPANIVALIGATGQGKSATFKQWLKEGKPARLMIWDTMDEYGDYARQCATLEAVVQATAAASFAVRYVPRGEAEQWWSRFDMFCRIAYERGDVTLGAEELNKVTRPNGGPQWWSDCTLRGRHKKLVIVGLSQRPAHVDKDFFSNATRVRCFRLNFRDDINTMAGVLCTDAERVQTLLPLQYVEREMATGVLAPGGLFGVPAPSLEEPRPAEPVERARPEKPARAKKSAPRRRKKRR